MDGTYRRPRLHECTMQICRNQIDASKANNIDECPYLEVRDATASEDDEDTTSPSSPPQQSAGESVYLGGEELPSHFRSFPITQGSLRASHCLS